jgi:hypothetical protein
MSALRLFALMLAFSAHAGEYARDPCPAPPQIKAQAGAIFTTYDTLSAEARRLDGLGKSHDAQCDRDLPKGSAAELACGASQLKLSGAIAEHDGRVDQYQGDLLALIDQALARTDARLAQTRGRLAAVAPAAQSWTREMDEWIATGEAARREARWGAFEKSAGLAIDQIKNGIDLQLAVAEKTRSSFMAWYAAAAPALTGTTRAAVERQILNLRAGRDVITLLQYIQEQHARAYSVARDLQEERNWAASGEAVAGALKLSLTLMKSTSPEAKLSVDIAELLIDDSYGWLARYSAVKRVEQFASLQDSQLAAVKSLSKLYVADVDGRKVLVNAKERLRSDACR